MKWLVLLNCGSYFLYYIGSRTLANTLEMNLVSVGIAYFAENQYGKSFLLQIYSKAGIMNFNCRLLPLKCSNLMLLKTYKPANLAAIPYLFCDNKE